MSAEALRGTLEKDRIGGRVDLGPSRSDATYPVVSLDEDIDNIALSDIGLLHYTGCKRYCMSGLLSEMVYRGIPVVAPDDSYVGKTVKRYGLGVTYAANAPSSLAEAMISAIERKGKESSESRYRFLEKTAPANALCELERRLL